MNEALGLFLLAVVSGAGLAALLAALSLLLPGPVERSRAALETAPGRTFVLGLVNLVFFLALAAVLVQVSDAAVRQNLRETSIQTSASQGDNSLTVDSTQAASPVGEAVLGLLAAIIVTGLTALAAVGLAGLVALTRERMNQPVSPLAGTLRAAVLLELAALTPFVGWWLFAPALLIASLGAGILSVVRRAPSAPAPAIPEAEA